MAAQVAMKVAAKAEGTMADGRVAVAQATVVSMVAPVAAAREAEDVEAA